MKSSELTPLLFTVYLAAASGRSPALPCFAAFLALVRFSGLFAFTQLFFQTLDKWCNMSILFDKIFAPMYRAISDFSKRQVHGVETLYTFSAFVAVHSSRALVIFDSVPIINKYLLFNSYTVFCNQINYVIEIPILLVFL